MGRRPRARFRRAAQVDAEEGPEAGREDLRFRLDVGPVDIVGQVQPDVNTLTRNAAAQAYEQAGLGPTISTSSNSTTASPPPS